MKTPIELSFGHPYDLPQEAEQPDHAAPTPSPDATTPASPPAETQIKPPEDLVSVDETGYVEDEVLPPPSLDDFKAPAAPAFTQPAESAYPQPAPPDTTSASPAVGAETDTPAAQPPEKISEATGELVIHKTVEQPTEPATDKATANQPSVQQAPTDAEEAKDGKPWWKIIHKAPKREDNPTDHSVSPPGDAESAPPTSDSADGGGDEPPQPPRPPEGGDESGDDEANEEKRLRLVKEVREFARVIKPLEGRDAVQEWGRTASAADKQLQQSISDLIAPLGEEAPPRDTLAGKLTSTDLASIKDLAARAAENILANESECSVGRAMGIHAVASWHTDALYGSKVKDMPPEKADQAMNNMTYFLTAFAYSLARYLPETSVAESPTPLAFFEVARRRAEGMAALMSNNKSWLDAKLDVFITAVDLRENAEDQAKREIPLETLSYEDLQRNNDSLARTVESRRQHGVKSAVHQEGSTYWSIHDASYLHEQQRAATQAERSNIRPQAWSRDMRLVVFESHPNAENKEKMIKPEFRPAGGDNPELIQVGRMFVMDKRGELYADAVGCVPLREIYKRVGKETNYEALRQYVLRTYVDLTVPFDVTQEARHATDATFGDEANRTPHGRDADNTEVVHDLLLPRIRVLQRYSRKDLEAKERAERNQVGIANEEDRKNNVIWHIRHIDPRYRASDEARARARERGIELPATGATFVREHHHPRAGQTGAHRAKYRKDGKGRDRRDNS